MLRKVALSLLMLVSLIVMLPLVSSTAHSIRYQASQNHRRVRRHSRAWWKRHRAMLRRRRAARLRRQVMAAAARKPQALTQLGRANARQARGNHVAFPITTSLPPSLLNAASSDEALPLPSGWSTTSAPAKGETRFRVADSDGVAAGHAALSVVAAAVSNTERASRRDQHRLLGGVLYADLRRTVIDKMITAGGWVINDMERDMSGRKVFVVVAQTPASNDGAASEQIWNFYFTEVDGRVYSLATNSVRQSSGRLASDAEKFITSLPAKAPTGPRISIR